MGDSVSDDVKSQYIETYIETIIESMGLLDCDDSWLISFFELALNKAEEFQEIKEKLKKDKSEDKNPDPVLEDGETLTWDEVARELGVRRNTLFKLLRQYGVLMEDVFTDSRTRQERFGVRHNHPYPEYEDRGWFKVNCMWCSVDVEITPKGLEGIKKRLKFPLKTMSKV